MTSPYLTRPLRTEAEAVTANAFPEIIAARSAAAVDPVAALRNLASAVTEMKIAAERVDRWLTIARLSLDRHDAAREAERRAEAEIAARMTT